MGLKIKKHRNIKSIKQSRKRLINQSSRMQRTVNDKMVLKIPEMFPLRPYSVGTFFFMICKETPFFKKREYIVPINFLRELKGNSGRNSGRNLIHYN